MSEFKEQAREQDEMIAQQSREEIDADFAVGMVRDGLHVFIDKTDEQLTYDMVFGYYRKPFNFESHTFTAPMLEVAHETFLENISGALDELNDNVTAADDFNDSIEDFAKTMYNDGDSQFKWNDGHSEWENIRESILSGKTEYIRAWLYEAVPGDFRQEIDNLREALDHYAVTYFKGQEYKNRQALYSIEQGDEIFLFKAPHNCTAEDILKIAGGDEPYAKLMEFGERIYDEGNYAAIQHSEQFTFLVDLNLDTDAAQIYEANGGKGGIVQSDRTDDNIRLSKIKISEFMQNKRGEKEVAMSEFKRKQEPMITVSSQNGTKNTFDVTSVGFDTQKQYTVAEFNQALKKANEKWQENWDGLSYPSNIMIVTVENLHNDPCSYRINLTDADYNSIQDIVELSPTPMHASISTGKAIEVLNRAEANTREQGIVSSKQDKTFAYAIGNSEPFTVVRLDIDTEERKKAVSEALKNIIYNAFGERNDMSQPYKNLLEQITPETEFVVAFEGHLSCLKYALRNAESSKELCISMLDSIKSVESSPEKTVIIKGYDCLSKDAWEEHGVKFTIGQSVDGDMSFYYARATDGKVTRDYEYDHKPDREKVMSDHADKLAEEDIDRGEAIYGADGYLAFPDPEMKHLVENIPQKQDISHNFNHADPTAQRGERYYAMNNVRQNEMIAKDFKYFFGDENVGKEIAAFAQANGINFEIHRYLEPYEERDPDRGYFYIISGTFADHHLFTLPTHKFRENSYGLKEFQPLPALIEALNKKIEDIASGNDNIVRYVNNDPQKISTFLNQMKGFMTTIEDYQKVEHILQKQDISHNFNHADPTAQRGERKDTMNTKFEVTSMTMLDGDNPKAIASVAINDELIVGGITVRANQEGELYVKMPQQKNGKDEQGKDKYEDRVFPTTAEARKAIDEAVLGTFENLAEQGLQNSYVKVEPPENSVSKIGVSLNKTNSEKSNVKATGQITVDNCFVIKGVTVTENVNSKTKEMFQSVNLPHFKQDKNGQYPPVVKPITAEMREKVNNAVMKSFNTQTRGVKFAEVGGKENSATYFRQNNQFAEKLMEQLENKGIPYHARISDTTTLSVKAADKAAVEDIKKEIANEGRKPSLLGEVGKIKAEQKAHEAEKPAPQKAKSNNQEL